MNALKKIKIKPKDLLSKSIGVWDNDIEEPTSSLLKSRLDNKQSIDHSPAEKSRDSSWMDV